VSSFGLVPLRHLLEILKACAPGFTWGATDHFYVVKYGGKTYPSLAKKDQIQGGQIRKMARHLGILDCVMSKLGR
jgi:hypothetical protein